MKERTLSPSRDVKSHSYYSGSLLVVASRGQQGNRALNKCIPISSQRLEAVSWGEYLILLGRTILSTGVEVGTGVSAVGENSDVDAWVDTIAPAESPRNLSSLCDGVCHFVGF